MLVRLDSVLQEDAEDAEDNALTCLSEQLPFSLVLNPCTTVWFVVPNTVCS